MFLSFFGIKYQVGILYKFCYLFCRTIKPIKREPGIMGETDGGEMPELARISPLVTRPPKPKSPNQSFSHGFFQHSPTGSGLPSTPGGSGEKSKSHLLAEVCVKSIGFSGGKGFGVSLSAPPADHMKTPTSSLTPLPTRGRPRGTGNKQHTATAPPATPGVSPGLYFFFNRFLCKILIFYLFFYFQG